MKPILHYYPIADGVTAFSTTRHGGYSCGNYGEFNINRYCGDAPEAIARNRKLLCEELGITDDRLVMPHQVHGVTVARITQETQASPLEGVDAVMTDVKGVCIGVSTADCIPIILYDAEHGAACAIHAGWRGTVARIAREAVLAMVEAYHTRPAQLKAVIGPGISLRNFEVGQEVYDAFEQASFPMAHITTKMQKWHIDLWEANRLQLHATGVLPEEIQVAGICTYDRADDFFSARRLGIASGRIFTGIVLR